MLTFLTMLILLSNEDASLLERSLAALLVGFLVSFSKTVSPVTCLLAAMKLDVWFIFGLNVALESLKLPPSFNRFCSLS
jgi:hypothetical protein